MNPYFAGQYYAASQLDSRYRDALERIIFFNEEQWRVRASMLAAIESHGGPTIVCRGNFLAVELERGTEVQTLFVLKDEGPAPRLSGVVVFTRVAAALRVIYIGLEPIDTHGEGDQAYLFVEIFQLLLGIGRRISGVKFIEFNKGRRLLRLSVDGRP